MQNSLFKKGSVFIIIVLIFGTSVLPSTKCSSEIALPTPDYTNRYLELSICRRMSMRDFDGTSVSDQGLSNILWAAYGYTDNGKRTIHGIDGRYSIGIYVIKRDGTYKYIPETHSLSLFKIGDYTFIGQHDTAPVKIGLVWDKRVSDDENMAMAEIGAIAQNIYFEANALNLGTVTTVTDVDQLNLLELPSYEKPEIIMPLGYPLDPYDFTYVQLPPSNLPLVVNNSIGFEDSINSRHEAIIWKDEPLTSIEQSQIIWASYGYSYFIDNLKKTRHRTVPSAYGIYPLLIFAVNHTGVYRYSSGTHSIAGIVQGDKRSEISGSVESDDVVISSASWVLISFLDTDKANNNLNYWYYEAGAIAHNVFLETTALNLSANLLTSIIDADALRSALGISSQTNLLPLFIMPTGRPFSSDLQDKLILSGPKSGKTGIEYIYTVVTTYPEENNISYFFDWGDGTNSGWTEFADSGVEVSAVHAWNAGIYDVKVHAIDEYDSTIGIETLTVLVDTCYCNNMGHLIDIDSDGTYDLFYCNATGKKTVVQKQDNNTYLIDSDEDDNWDYIFDLSTGITTYPKEDEQKETPGFELIIAICAMVVFLFWKRRWRKRL